jgi:Fe-S-cluster containining protein
MPGERSGIDEEAERDGLPLAEMDGALARAAQAAGGRLDHRRGCPALDPPTGSCDLYSDRPLSCRSYGPPVRVGSQDLPPCHLCFVGSAEEAESCRALLDPEGREDALLRDLAARRLEGETIVAFALAAEV